MKIILTALTALSLGLPASANLSIAFKEGAPKDRIVLSHLGGCPLNDATVVIDLADSAGQLIFDTEGTGAGVEVFQPLVVEQGATLLAVPPSIEDGATLLTLDVTRMAPGEVITLSTDLDDTLGAREITVSGAEFSGVAVSLVHAGQTARSVFSQTPVATTEIAGC